MGAYVLSIVDENIPITDQEAKVNDEVKDQMGVMDKVMDSLHKNFTWDLVKLQKG